MYIYVYIYIYIYIHMVRGGNTLSPIVLSSGGFYFVCAMKL